MDFPLVLIKRLARAALAACAGAFLTLYVFNNYPSSCCASESDWLTIDQVFDFQVPQSVIEGGVSNGIAIDDDGVSEMEQLLTAEQTYLLNLADDVSEWDMANRLSGGKLGTNYYQVNLSGLWTNDYESQGFSSLALGFARNDASGNQYMWAGEDNPFFVVPNIDSVSSMLTTDTLPEDSPFQQANPLLQGLSPPSGWFLTSLRHGSLYEAVFSPFDTEIGRLSTVELFGIRIFSYLPVTLQEVCANLESLLSDSRIVPRRLLALPLALLNILLIFRWWLWRITRVWALISGDSDASLSASSSSGGNE